MHGFERYDILPCMRVPRSTTDTSYPVRDIAPLFIRLKFILLRMVLWRHLEDD